MLSQTFSLANNIARAMYHKILQQDTAGLNAQK